MSEWHHWDKPDPEYADPGAGYAAAAEPAGYPAGSGFAGLDEAGLDEAGLDEAGLDEAAGGEFTGYQSGGWADTGWVGDPPGGEQWLGEPTLPGRAGRRRPPRRHPALLLAACGLVALGVIAVIWRTWPHLNSSHAGPAAAVPSRLTGGGTQPAAAQPPAAITRPAATQVLAQYVAAINAANRTRSDSDLAAATAGSSYRLDTGAYQFAAAADGTAMHYQPSSFMPAGIYIPRLATWPHWFVAGGTWTRASSGSWRGYLVFAQAGPQAPWLAVLQPNLTGRAATPATDRDGYAVAVAPATSAGLAAPPETVPEATAARLDGTAGGPRLTGLRVTADLRARDYWQDPGRLPTGSDVAARHYATQYGIYALRTAGGGVAMFYSLNAVLTLTPPPGTPMAVQIPGYYSAADQLTGPAAVPFADQFAAVIPPAGSSSLVRVIGQTSGIAGTR